MAAAPIETPQGELGWLAVAAALAVAVAAAVGFVRLRGTTLAAPAVWAIVAALVYAAVEAALACRPDLDGALGASLARYAAAVGTSCPLMAVLGAKRPQDRGWQWVVLSLWLVLLVPAGQAWAARSGVALLLPIPWRLLIIALCLLGVLNYAPTKWGGAATLAALGQAGLLSEWFIEGGRKESIVMMSLLAILLAAFWPVRPSPRIREFNPLSEIEAFTKRWLAFRNAWGAFWALRILQRVNETATLSNWPVRLEWSGFVSADAATPLSVDEATAAHIQQTMDSLLRRFERVE